MLLFGLGAALPLVILGSLSREAVRHMHGRLQNIGRYGKTALGLLFLGLGIAVMTGADKLAETWLLQRMPPWLLDLTVSL
jgi:cytochrome c-type biogenesis protein